MASHCIGSGAQAAGTRVAESAQAGGHGTSGGTRRGPAGARPGGRSGGGLAPLLVLVLVLAPGLLLARDVPFGAQAVISTAANEAESVYAADVDGDGDTDVLSASSYDDKIAWYENNGASPPAWTAHTITIAANGARSVYAACAMPAGAAGPAPCQTLKVERPYCPISTGRRGVACTKEKP